MQLSNRQCRLAARPEGLPRPSDWAFADEVVADIGDREFLVGVEYLPIDMHLFRGENTGKLVTALSPSAGGGE